jgi:phosphohistidine phosphatase
MDLILWRHAEAEDSNPKGDAARELTKHGRKQAERMAGWLRPQLDGHWKIISSPATRTVQTVEALGLPYETRAALDTSASAAGVLREAGWPGAAAVVVVGHQPTLGEVAALLLGGDGEMAVRKGSILWFSSRERDGRPQAVLERVVDPSMLEGAGKV